MKHKSWQGMPVVGESHKEGLEHQAALNEFEHGMEREQAEEEAYKAYRKEHHLNGAAHHLRGLRSAQASNDLEEAKKHGVAYGLHMEALGHDPLDQVPDEVKNLVEGDEVKPQYRFKAHSADRLLLDD